MPPGEDDDDRTPPTGPQRPRARRRRPRPEPRDAGRRARLLHGRRAAARPRHADPARGGLRRARPPELPALRLPHARQRGTRQVRGTRAGEELRGHRRAHRPVHPLVLRVRLRLPSSRTSPRRSRRAARRARSTPTRRRSSARCSASSRACSRTPRSSSRTAPATPTTRSAPSARSRREKARPSRRRGVAPVSRVAVRGRRLVGPVAGLPRARPGLPPARRARGRPAAPAVAQPLPQPALRDGEGGGRHGGGRRAIAPAPASRAASPTRASRASSAPQAASSCLRAPTSLGDDLGRAHLRGPLGVRTRGPSEPRAARHPRRGEAHDARAQGHGRRARQDRQPVAAPAHRAARPALQLTRRDRRADPGARGLVDAPHGGVDPAQHARRRRSARGARPEDGRAGQPHGAPPRRARRLRAHARASSPASSTSSIRSAGAPRRPVCAWQAPVQ
jgi:hypothetical protein